MEVKKVVNSKVQNLGQGKKEVPAKTSNKEQKQLTELSNVYYRPSFGRSWSEHKSWGAVIDPKTKEASFKIFTYPDTRKVTVTIEKRDGSEKNTYELKNEGRGIFQTEKGIPAEKAAHGDKYYYTIYKGNGEVDKVKDPYSFRQETLLGESTLYDHSLFEWSDKDWFENNKNRISRKANAQNGLTHVSEARIFEFNTETLTKRGTFKSAKSVLNSIAQMGFNAIEIMPAENTYSFNWGYDGVDKHAAAEHLGGPDGLKSLINYAHEIGLNVIMDMVPNHLGPDGASLKQTGPYIKGSNGFGEAFNYEGQNSRYVRDYMVNAAINWLDNYHCDGLRLDMTKFMESDYAMKQIAAEINYHKPDAFLIAEDGRDKVSVDDNGQFWSNPDEVHDKRVVNPLKDYESAEGKSESEHCRAIDEISNGNTSLGRLGYDSEWDFNYYHTLNESLYGNIDLDKLEKAFYCAQDSVKYVMSHDEIGNFEGSRLISKLLVPMLNLNENITLNAQDIERARQYSEMKNCPLDSALQTVKAQKAQFTSEKLAIMLQSGMLDKYDTSGKNMTPQKKQALKKAFKTEVLMPMGIKSQTTVSYNKLKYMYNKCVSKYKMALALTYSIPGLKMVFQGDERGDLTPFRFFRQFESMPTEDYLYTEKGYDTSKPALNESKLGSINYSNDGKAIMSRIKALTADLNKVNAENPALTKGRLISEDTVKHNSSNVIAAHACDSESNNEIYTITNFKDASYPSDDASYYYIKFPKGTWVEILNTDSKKYGGSGDYKNIYTLDSNGDNLIPVKMAGQSVLMFKRIG